MIVKAKYQIAYSNKLYFAGDTFEIEEQDFLGDYKNDVIEVIEGEKIEENKFDKETKTEKRNKKTEKLDSMKTTDLRV